MFDNLLECLTLHLSIGERAKFMCNRCKVETNHELRYCHDKISYQGKYDPNDSWGDTPRYAAKCQYRLWICLGCETACLQYVTLADTLHPDHDDFLKGENEVLSCSFYPERYIFDSENETHTDAIPHKKFNSISVKIQQVYKEIIGSYNADLILMCAIGLRALLEGICVEKGIQDTDAFGLHKKLKLLEKRQILPSNIVEGLYSFKFMGDDAAHRLEMTNKAELKIAIEIVEDLLNLLYELDYRISANSRSLLDNRLKQSTKTKTEENTDTI